MADDEKKPEDNDEDEKPGFSEEDEEPKTAVETVDAKKAQRESPVGDFPGSSSPSSEPKSDATEAAKTPDDDGASGKDDEDDDDDGDDDDDDDDDDDEDVAAKPSPARSEPPAPKKPAAEHGHGHDDHGFGHLVSVPLLGGILFVLLVLTVITVAASKVDLGAQLNLIVALIIATVKAGLVVTFFMHLLWDKRFNTLVFLSSVFFMVLFLSIAMTDRGEYQHLIEEREAAQRALK